MCICGVVNQSSGIFFTTHHKSTFFSIPPAFHLFGEHGCVLLNFLAQFRLKFYKVHVQYLASLGSVLCRLNSVSIAGDRRFRFLRNVFCLYTLIFCKRFCLAVAATYPLLEILQVYGSYHRLVLLRPIFVIVGKISRLGIGRLIEAKHYLMLVKAAVLVVLIHHKRFSTVPPINIIR